MLLDKAAQKAEVEAEPKINQGKLLAYLESEPAPFPAFITNDEEVIEIPDLPEDLGHTCALASEATLQKFWNMPEDAAWRK